VVFQEKIAASSIGSETYYNMEIEKMGIPFEDKKFLFVTMQLM
jgi:hypothetical protein